MIAAPIVVGAGAFALFTAPGFVRDAVSERVLRATGLATVIESASLGFGGVSLHGVRIGDHATHKGPTAAIESIEVDANPWMLLLSGRSAVREVRVRGAKINVPLHDAQTRAVQEKLRARAQGETAESTGSQASRDDFVLSVEGFVVDVADEHGALAHVENARVSSQRTNGKSSFDLSSKRVALGGTSIELSDLHVRAERGENGLVLSGAEVIEATLRLPPEGEVAPERTLYARCMRALAPAPSAQKTTPKQPTQTSKAASLLDHFSKGARLELKRGRVLRADGSAVLTDLAASAKLEVDTSIGLTGKGQGEQGGAVGWDLRVWPAQLRAEGTVDVRALPLSVVAPLLPAVPWHEPENARVEASLRLTAESADKIMLAGEVKLSGVGLSSPRLAAVPVRGIDIVAGGRGSFVPAQRRLEIEQSEVSIGKSRASLSGSIAWAPPSYAIDLVAKLPSTRCNEAVHSIPADLLGDLALATFHGSIGGSITLNVSSHDLASTVLDVDINDRCDFVTVPAMADLRRFDQPFVHQVLEPDGTLFEMETGPGTPAWTYLGDISPFFVHAVLAHEDAGFYGHRGFSLLHIRNALARNLQEGRYVVGASTITMQLVKNVFLHREKTLARKIQEVLLTWWIERVMDKSDIIELYLNVIEYGPSVYGIRDAARHYFGRLPAQLSPAEGAYLATILPAPKRYHVHYEHGAVPTSWLERMRKLIVRLKERGALGPESSRFGLAELAAFKFVPEGSIPEPRIVPTDVGPLPHMGADALWGSGGSVPTIDPNALPESDDEETRAPQDDEWGDRREIEQAPRLPRQAGSTTRPAALGSSPQSPRIGR